MSAAEKSNNDKQPSTRSPITNDLKYKVPPQTIMTDEPSSPRFTDELRETAGDQWDKVVEHKFPTELAAGTIDREVLKRYLIQDFRFLDAFCVLLGSIVAHARTLEDRIPACQFLALVTSKENTYFQRCFDAMGVTADQREEIPDMACTTGFGNLMRDAALNGTLAEMLSVIVVCEWSYLSWANRVLQQGPVNRDDFVTYEWVDLHSGSDFEGLVDYLRKLLDKEGAFIDEAEKEKCRTRFLSAVQLEQDFFDMAYEIP